MMGKLVREPCPFCGGVAKLVIRKNNATVHCSNSGCLHWDGWFDSKELAVKVWNFNSISITKWRKES